MRSDSLLCRVASPWAAAGLGMCLRARSCGAVRYSLGPRAAHLVTLSAFDAFERVEVLEVAAVQARICDVYACL